MFSQQISNTFLTKQSLFSRRYFVMFSRISNIFIVCIMLIGFGGALQASAATEEEMMATWQAMVDSLNAHNEDYLALLTDDIVLDALAVPPPLEGKEAVAAYFGALYQGFPDIHWDAQRTLVSADAVVVQYLATGTHLGVFNEIPPTENTVQMPIFEIFEFEDDKIKKITCCFDNANMLVQLGVMPAPEPLELVPSFTLPDAEATGLAPLEADAELISRFNTHDLSEFAKILHRDAEIKFNALGMIPMNREEYVALNELYLLSNSTLRGDVVRGIDMGDGWVVAEIVFSGIHDGPYFGIPATGLPSEVRTAWIAHYDADGLLTNMNFYFDNLTVLTQIGAFPPLPPLPEYPPIPDYLVQDEITSPSLEGNLLGDAATRDVLVYLPPSYETSPDKRYPTIYLLHGGTGDHRYFVFSVNVSVQSLTGIDLGVDIGDIVNNLMAAGDLGEVIIVMPDASNIYNNGRYERSEVIGDYQDYIARDLVEYIDGKYRTIPDREHRGITGHSVGGYGALSLAIEYNDVFRAVAALSPGSENDVEVSPTVIERFIAKNPDTLGEPILVYSDEDMWRMFLTKSDTNRMYSYAAAYSPNPNNPPYYVDLPVQYPDKTIVPEVWEKWKERDLVSQIERDGANLANTSIFIDQGVGETMLAAEVPGIANTLAALDAQGIPYTYDEFPGDHVTHLRYQLESALKFLYPHIAPPPDPEANKAIVRRVYEECLNQKNLSLLDESHATDYVFHLAGNPDIQGGEGFKQLLALYFAAFPDFHVTIEDMIAEGDMVVVRDTASGTHQGELMGIPPTGKQVKWTGINIHHFENGKFAESWTNMDSLGIMQQLGAIPPTGNENYTWGEPSEVTGDPGDPEANKAILRRWVEEGLNQNNLDIIDEIYATNCLVHVPPNPDRDGSENLKQVYAIYRAAFPNYYITIENMIAEGDKVVCRVTACGTHEGEFVGIPPTGKQVTWTGITINRFASGKIAETWQSWDALGFMQQLTPPPVDTEANKAIVRRYLEEFWNKGNMDVADEIIDPEYIHYTAGVPDIISLEEAKQSIAEARTAFPDLQWTVDDIFAEGDKVVVRETFRGTHQGEFMGIPPTGKQVTMTGIGIGRVAGGKLVEAQGNYDMLGMMQQLGVIPPDREDYTWGEPSEVTGDPGDPEENKAIVRRLWEEVLNQRNLSLIDELYATNAIIHEPAAPNLRDPEGFKQFFSTVFAAFPDAHWTVEDMFAEGDKVVSRFTANFGTHKGEFMGIPPTGRQVTITGIVINRFADGKIVEDWESGDFLGFMQQLTAPPVDTEANKALARRVFEEVFNQMNLDLVDEIFAADYVGHVPPNPDVHGPEGFKQFSAMLSAGFPDSHYTIEGMIAEGDKVTIRWTALGTHQGEFMGIPPTGNRVTTAGITIYRIANGLIEEDWTNANFLGLFQQIGAIPPDSEDFTWGVPSEVTGNPGDPETNKAIMRGIVEEVINQKNLDLVDELYSTDYVYHFPPNPEIHGAEGFKQYFATAFAAFPDFHITIEDMFAEGDKVVSRITARGTHEGEFMGIPPTGVQGTVTGIAIHRFASGKLVEDWENVDFLGLMQQFGVIPPMAPKDYSNVFFMPLAQGLNMVSLPLEPQTPYTARSFAEMLSATTVIKLDEARQRFVGFTLDAPDDGFAIKGGKGYIVNVPEGGMVAFVGAAWTRPPMPAAPVVRGLNPRTTDGAWAFVVSGRLDVEQVANLFHVTVRNTRTDAVATEIARAGYFAAAFADLTRKSVIEVGDRLEVTVRTDEFVSDPFLYTVTPENIRQAFLPITLKNVEIPRQSLLLQNYPNPFNPETWIPYQTKEPAEVVIRIYNLRGQLVRTLSLGHRKAGFYLGRSRAAYWDGLNSSGEKVASGAYFYQIEAGNFSATRKMLIVK